MEPRAYETRQAIGPGGRIEKRNEKHHQAAKVEVKVKTVTQSRSESPQQLRAAVIYARVKGCWKCAACLLCGGIQRDWITKHCALFYFIIYELSLTTGSR